VAIDALNAAGAQGVVVDLRGNGGGFLDEAINCAGVFVGEEPVVRVRNRRGEVRVDKPTHPSRRYDKPVIALVDEGTASGAEIIAQSLRDFDQALIVGSNTAGKGNVQSVVLLSALSNGLKNVKTGAAKITVQNFFTADGSEAEGRCIQPDITLPGIPFLQRYESTQISNHGTGTTLPNLLRSPIPADAERRARLLSNSGKRQKAETDLLYLTKWSARAYHASSPSSGNLQSLEKSIASRIKEKVQCLAEGKALANGAAPLIEIDPSNTASNKVDHSDIAEEFSDLPWIPSIDPALNESFRVLADSID
ncbi:MAG TPA: S41 family peptidase, partial [Opitutaceae bacterium]